jgi:hypothetical protein
MAESKPHLVVHFDVNETILIGDPAGGDTYDDSLNKVLAKSAFLQAPDEPGKYGACATPPTCWHDGTPLTDLPNPPPPLKPEWTFDRPDGMVAFYKQSALKRAHAKRFADEGSPGVVYAAERAKMREALGWAHAPHAALSNGSESAALLPAFFRTLEALRTSGRSFSVVLRTFGHDLPRVTEAINAYAKGEHPDFPAGAPELALPPSRMWLGRYESASGRFTLSPHDAGSGAPTITSESEVVAALSQPGVSAVMDDYNWWDGHGNVPSAGKPLWLTLGDADVQHLFFDDNIHNDPNDSIVSVRVRATSGTAAFVPLSGAQICALHGTVLRRVPTLLPVLDGDWFVHQIEECAMPREDRPTDLGDPAGEPHPLVSRGTPLAPQYDPLVPLRPRASRCHVAGAARGWRRCARARSGRS